VRTLRAWVRRALDIFGGARRDGDIAAELHAHLQSHIDANLSTGMTPEEARRIALLTLGGVEQAKELARDARSFGWLDDARADVRYSLRTLHRSPGFAATAVSVIALGIGATTAAFTLLDYVMLRPLPFPQPEQLVRLFQNDTKRNVPRLEATPPNFLDWRAMNHSFSAIGSYLGVGGTALLGQGEPRVIDRGVIDSQVLKILGVEPLAGRGFVADDERDGAVPVVLLSHDFAAALFGDAAASIGRELILDNRPRTVVGVMPRGFAFPSRDAMVWIPMPPFTQLGMSRTNLLLNVVARLKPGTSVEDARADMAVIAANLERGYPLDNTGVRVAVVDMRDVLSPEARGLVAAVFGAASCLLLIACTNLANLLLARAMARRHELAVRIAIGAGRGRLVRQLLTESLVLAVSGGVLGCGLAVMLVPMLARLVPAVLPVGAPPAIDIRVLAFAAIVTLTTSLAVGVGPALRSWRHADPRALRSRSSGAAGDRLRSVLVFAEVAATVTLLVGAGLLLKALWRVQAVDVGFRAEGMLTARTELPMPKYRTPEARRGFYDRVLTDIRALPGVTSAAYTTGLPLALGGGVMAVTSPGIVDDQVSAPRASVRFVTPDFFSTMRIPLRRGRYLGAQDDATAPFVVVMSESLARRFWPDQDPIGRQITVFNSSRVVAGVVGDIVVRGLERSSEPQLYFSPEQQGRFSTFYMPRDLIVRASGDPMTLAPAVRRIVQRADPQQPVANVRMFDELVALQTTPRRDQLMALGVLAAIALFLAAIGIHGLLSFTVSSRTQELGVRLALGADRADILRMVLGQGLSLGIAGAAVAIPLAYAAAHGMSALLFGLAPGDPAIYATATALALILTLASGLRPALRASRIDPATAIRNE
jgi:predicted permease